MSTVSQGSLPDMTEEVLGNFSAILESMDFAQELELLGIRKLHFRQRKRAIRELRAMIDETESTAVIEVDGGISAHNSRLLFDAGADALVAGSAVFGAPDPQAEIERMLQS